VLASDYFYPAPLLAAFRLMREAAMPLGGAWALVSSGPAAAAGLTDRGAIEPGLRGDVIVVDASDPDLPRVAAAFSAGRLIHAARYP
jgi:alpha-D-ribose 1-methylphosphonate 5-triphosphate diphosphatase